MLHSLWRQPGQDSWRHSLPPSQSGRAARVPPQGTEPVLSRIQLKIAPESLPRLDSVVAFTVAAARMRGRGGSAAALSSGRYSTKSRANDGSAAAATAECAAGPAAACLGPKGP